MIVPRFNNGANPVRKFFKASKRREMDISTVSAAFAIELGDDGMIKRARVAYGGVAAMPARARLTEQALVGKPLTARTGGEMLPFLEKEFAPISDVRGSAAYRRGLISNLFQKFFEQTEEAGPARTTIERWLPENVEVTGPIAATLYVASSAPHTDFTAKLVDVHGDGSAYNVSDGVVRRAYTSSATPAQADPEVIEIMLWPTSMVFRQ